MSDRMHAVRIKVHIVTVLLLLLALLPGCGEEKKSAFSEGLTYEDYSEDASLPKGSRGSKLSCLTVSSPGERVFGSKEIAIIDVSNASEGYVSAQYFGDCGKVKFQITLPDGTVYSYNLSGNIEYFPLPGGDGEYTLGVYENITETQYAIALSETLEVKIENEFGPSLYPNQYCMFDESTKFVQKGVDLSYSMNSDLDLVTNVFDYVLCTMSYDVEKAETIGKGYVCNLDEIYETRKGICLDYAAIMACILRSQGIPTRLQVGYAGTAYHAWISIYLNEKGWVNGLIEFDGENWSLMDPTLADNEATDKLVNFIGDGSNYTQKYVY